MIANRSRCVLMISGLLLGACSPRPEAAVHIGPAAAAPTVVDPGRGRGSTSAFTVAMEVVGEVGLWPVEGALLVGALPYHGSDDWKFAAAETSGLRYLPDLLVPHEQRYGSFNFHGRWPSNLWLTFYDERPRVPGVERRFFARVLRSESAPGRTLPSSPTASSSSRSGPRTPVA